MGAAGAMPVLLLFFAAALRLRLIPLFARRGGAIGPSLYALRIDQRLMINLKIFYQSLKPTFSIGIFGPSVGDGIRN